MTLEEFKTLSKEQLEAYGDTIPFGSVYDTNKNILTYKDSTFCPYMFT